ncbi:MAG TPA: thiamine phosphate synthase [Hyphomonadaceae bacterium]|jgi:thiamine-phosphate pyrophosphorylase|nr:thiamine phosphate synthase [Hyphomonadaceae bacterium]
MSLSQPQAAARRKLFAAARMAKPAFVRGKMRNPLPMRTLPRVWFMTEPKRTPNIERTIAALPRGWGVIYRHFGAHDRLGTAHRLARLCRGRLVFLIAADPGLALAVRADGVHWPEAKLRRVRPGNPRWIETASAHSRAALARAAWLGVDAAILSPVFDSASPSAGKPLGPLAFRLLARAAPLPVYALGGISARTAARALSGAAGFAAIDGIAEAWSG